MPRVFTRIATGAAVLCVLPALADAQAVPSVRSLGSVVATSPVAFGAVTQLVSLSDGRVFVVDAGKRLVSLLDPSLHNPIVVLDSAQGKANSFNSGVSGGVGGRGAPVSAVTVGGRAGGPAGAQGAGAVATGFLIPFRADSSLWFDRSVGGLVVIDPAGKLGRVMAPPVSSLGSPFVPAFGPPMSSATFGLVYKTRTPFADSPPRPANAPDSVVRSADSALVVRMNYATRATDTVAKIGLGTFTVRTMRGDGIYMVGSATPYPFVDNVVVTTDGSIALFHAREYRVEWFTADGQHDAVAKLAHSWRPITDEMRRHILDSTNGVKKHVYDSLMASRVADSIRTGSAPMVMGFDFSADGEAVQRQRPMPPPRMPSLLVAEDIPDFFPPTASSGDVLADADNHVWIRAALAIPEPGFAVWEVISRTGGIVDRIRVPESRTIAGFGPGVVYLVARDAGISTLEKVRLRP